jgi:putative hydrolase of the HAD superfamily
MIALNEILVAARRVPGSKYNCGLMAETMLIWDFDGTLARRQGKWSGALVEVLDAIYPGHGFISGDLRPHIQSGFPWHKCEQTNEPNLDPAVWWERLTPIFKRAYMLGANYPETQATNLARSVREGYLNQERWSLYDDVVRAVSCLSKIGYRHVILSNHVPELSQLLAGPRHCPVL